MYTRQNELENLQLWLEVDSGHEVEDEELLEYLKAADEETKLYKVVLCGETSEGVLEDCSYICVDPHYSGELSPGQRQLYEILLNLQDSAVYSLTTIGKLAQMMNLKWAAACGKRLENLQSLGAIAGLKA